MAPIREDILKLQQAGYAAAFMEQATETETPLPEIFELTTRILKTSLRRSRRSRKTFSRSNSSCCANWAWSRIWKPADARREENRRKHCWQGDWATAPG